MQRNILLSSDIFISIIIDIVLESKKTSLIKLLLADLFYKEEAMGHRHRKDRADYIYRNNTFSIKFSVFIIINVEINLTNC
jgi:hypothetical protein